MGGAGFLSLVIVGHVDHGKSTLAGRLLLDTGSLPQGKLEQLRKKCAADSRPFEYAFLLDSLKDEQSKGITIDTTRIFFRTPRRRYMLFDAPGHTEFLKNMVTGAAKAEAALLVIDAQEGVRENSRRHGILLSLLGIGQVAVLVNKMDRVSYSREVFERIRSEYGAFLHKLGVTPVECVPTVALEGENVAVVSSRMPWYTGPTVLQTLEKFEGARSFDSLAFRMPVQDVLETGEPVPVGRVESGSVGPGDELVFQPSGARARLRRIEGASGRASAGKSIGLILEPSARIGRGEIACREDEIPPRISSEIRARVFWLNERELKRGDRCVLKLGTARREATVAGIESILSAENLENLTGRPSVRANEVAQLRLSLDQPIAHELGEAHPILGRFVIGRQYEIGGGGVILP